MKSIAVIIVNYRTPDLAIACVDALASARAAYPELRVTIVDGGSEDGSAEQIAGSIATNGQGGWVTALPLAINGGFAYANNRALWALMADGTQPDAIALINPDARVRPGAVETMVALLDREPAAGAVGAQLEHEDGRAQASAFTWPSIRGEFCRGARTGLINRLLSEPPVSVVSSDATKVPWVTGAAVMFRTAALCDCGIFDEGFFLYFEETDLMRRLTAAGWDVWHEPAARVVHQGGAATKIRDPETGLLPSKPMPLYWYESRRRYFALAGGRGRALLASLAWLAGHLFYRARRLLLPKSTASDGPQRPGRDLLRVGFWPNHRDTIAAVPSLRSPLPAQPAWMKSAE